MPNASVTKPGASISVPPIRISAPSASSVAGIRPLLERVAQRPPGAAALVLDQPGAEDAVEHQQQRSSTRRRSPGRPG